MSSQPPCKTWAEKLALRQEDLSPADRAALATHLQTCPACSAVWEDYRLLDSRLRALPQPALKPLPRLSFSGPEEEEESVFSGRHALPVALIIRLILIALLLFFGIQSANNNASQAPGTSLFTSGEYGIYRAGGYVDAVAWSPNGRLIASGSWDHTVQIWAAPAPGNSLRSKGPDLGVAEFNVGWQGKIERDNPDLAGGER